MIVDAHVHVWQIARGDYGWLTPDLPIHRDVTIADLRAVAPGIDGAVLVQAAPTEAETGFLLATARAHPDVVRGVVGWTDLAAAGAPARIEAMARDATLVGLRPMLQDLPDPDWILRPAVARALDAMAACGLALDLLIRPIHLTRCRDLARRHPGLRIVIDHMAKPDIAAGGYDAFAASLAGIAADTGVSCKLSGLITEAGGGGWPAVTRYIGLGIDLFAPDRLIWGSDWPVLQLAGDYQAWLGTAQAMIRARAATAEPGIFAGNALRFYRRTA